MGSKSRIAKYIVPIIQRRMENYNIKTFIDCFCGGCNIIDKVKCNKKIASDNNEFLIELFKHKKWVECTSRYSNKRTLFRM